MKLSSDVRKYLAENRVQAVRFNNGIFYSINEDIPELDEPNKPAELIKDEKIRKAVRAWAEVNSIKKALYAERPNRSLCCFTDMGEDDYAIEFVGWVPTLEDSEVYTIEELCGGEDEC